MINKLARPNILRQNRSRQWHHSTTNKIVKHRLLRSQNVQ